MKRFHPLMAHSWGKPMPMPFHKQMLADFATVEAISDCVLSELELGRLPPRAAARLRELVK
jgi:hypothetical protein